MHIFTNPNYNFLRWRWHAVALSWIVIIAGLGLIYTRGLAKGVEFAGGTSMIMQFDTTPAVAPAYRSVIELIVRVGAPAGLVTVIVPLTANSLSADVAL